MNTPVAAELLVELAGPISALHRVPPEGSLSTGKADREPSVGSAEALAGEGQDFSNRPILQTTAPTVQTPVQTPVQTTGKVGEESGVPILFSCSDLTVRLGASTVVQSLDLRAKAGEWIGLLGPNGAGKSSALRALSGVLRSQGSAVSVIGTVEVNGKDLAKLDRKAIGRLIAVVPQTPIIPVGMTVFDYALLGRTPHLGWFGRPGGDDRALVFELLERLDLAGFADRLITSLSGGERQRAVIARALAQQAPVLLLDEPTSALDVGHQQQVLELVDELRIQHGLVILSAMHDLTLAGQYAHHLVLLVQGVGVGCGSPADVLIAEVLERHYNARLRSVHSADGRIAVVPTR